MGAQHDWNLNTGPFHFKPRTPAIALSIWEVTIQRLWRVVIGFGDGKVAFVVFS